MALMLLAAIFLSIQNVIVRLFFEGTRDIGSVLSPNFEHTVLFLQVRTFFMVLSVGLLAWRIYPKAFSEIKDSGAGLKSPILSGSIYFVTVILLYLGIGNIPTGIAITLFFIHPAIALLLGWRFNQEKPTLFRWLIIGGVILGLILVTPNLQADLSSQFIFGSLCALGAGIGFALYATTAQRALIQFHPISFSLVTFTLLFLLSSLTVLLMRIEIPTALLVPVILWSFASGLITVGGLVCTNIGIRLVGAPTATLIGSSEPILTGILAWLILQENLELRQIAGIIMVTIFIAGLGMEKQQSAFHRNRS